MGGAGLTALWEPSPSQHPPAPLPKRDIPRCSEPPKTLPASPLLWPPHPCLAEPPGERPGVLGRWLPSPLLQEGPSSPLAALPVPQHPTPGTSRKPQPQPAGRLITVTSPILPAPTTARGGGTQHSCPRAQGKELHPRHAHGSPTGPVSSSMELGALTGCASRAQDACPAPAQGTSCPRMHQQPSGMGTRAASTLLARHTAPHLVCASNTDVAGECHSTEGEEKVAGVS